MDDEEYNLNIDDIDYQVRYWAKTIASGVRMIKAIYTNQYIFDLFKRKLREQTENDMFIKMRYDILFKLFDLLNRVEKIIRKAASNCLKNLIKMENNPKDLVSNDDKLKQILRPILICL